MSYSICAIIVTYNRKKHLIKCLNSINYQTYPVSHIIVVNNASSDGTIDCLHKYGWYNSDNFTLINLSRNEGGAGGFHKGIELAYQKKFDYIWLMDDDGYPKENCLEKLLPYLSYNSYIGPIVLDTKNNGVMSFSLRIPGTSFNIDKYSDIPINLIKDNVIQDAILPFNGTLFSTQLVEKIGLPCGEFFIWGDEKEYTLRASKFGANIFTVIDAIFYHPKQSSSSKPMFFGKMRFNYADSDLKQYCFCRNSVFIYSNYKRFHYVLAFWLKTTWFFTITEPNWKKLIFTWKAMWHGLVRDLSHHREYL